MKKLLLTALLLAFALTGVVTTEGNDDTTTGNDTPTTEEGTTTTEGDEEDYGVMPTDALCDIQDCWGV